VSDEDLEGVLTIQILQYMLWIIDAGTGASDEDALIVSTVTGKQLDADAIDSLIFDDFIPEGFANEEPSALFALAKVMAITGEGDPSSLILPIYENIGNLLTDSEPLWDDERRERVVEYYSMLRRNISMLMI